MVTVRCLPVLGVRISSMTLPKYAPKLKFLKISPHRTKDDCPITLRVCNARRAGLGTGRLARDATKFQCFVDLANLASDPFNSLKFHSYCSICLTPLAQVLIIFAAADGYIPAFGIYASARKNTFV